MAESLLVKLERLRTAATEMAERNARLAARNAQLESENEELRRAAQQADADRQRAELDVEFLRVSHRLADNPDSIIETRRHIAKLIRNIDRCLEMLSR